MSGDVEARVHWSRSICKQPGNYIGWPTVARKSDGELLAVFSGDRETHICPYGKTQMVRSRDGGETWTHAETINSTPLDDRDAGIVVMRSGTIVVSWFTSPTWENIERFRERAGASTARAWERHCDKISLEARQRWLGQWTRRSTDGGHTWEPEVDSKVSAPHGPIELHDGRLLYVGNSDLHGSAAPAAAESTDEGRSWQLIGAIPVPKEYAEELPYHEPHTVETADGQLVCLWRHQPSDRPAEEHFMQQSESADGGRTWTVVHPTPMWGYPAHLVRLHSGDILATYGVRRPLFGQRACISRDGGKTWDINGEIILRDDAPNGDLGYPATIELEPGELLTIYYQIDLPGEKTSLIATRWSLGTAS